MTLNYRLLFRHLRLSQSGLAAVEFALCAPFVMGTFLAGAEITNFAVTKMQLSQIALHIADNAARIGTTSLNSKQQISELQINDLLVGANMQAGSLKLHDRGKVIISSVEPMTDSDTNNTYRIRWQRCYGLRTAGSSYGSQGDVDLDGMGPAGQRVTAPRGGGVIFVEISYNYQPLVSARLVPATIIRDIAAMTVRDDRYFAGNNGIGIYNNESVTPSSCT